VREAKRQEDDKRKHAFRVVGDEWATTKLEKENKAKSTIERERSNLARLNREIGDRPLCEIAPPELLMAFRRVEARGRYYTVGRLRSTASRVFQFGVVGASYCHPRLEACARQSSTAKNHGETRRPSSVPRGSKTAGSNLHLALKLQRLPPIVHDRKARLAPGVEPALDNKRLAGLSELPREPRRVSLLQ
jgi:hypothetical protein